MGLWEDIVNTGQQLGSTDAADIPKQLAARAVGDVGGLVGGAAKGTAKWLEDVIFKNPVEILKDPSSVLNSNGQISLTRLAFPEFRRQAVAAGQQAAEQQRAQQQLQNLSAMGKIADMFSGAATDTAQGELRKGLEAQGYDPVTLQNFANAAKSQRHAARKAAAESGAMPALSNVADINSAQRLGQTRFASDRKLAETAASGAETRKNQANQFGFSKKLAEERHNNRLDEIGYGGEVQGAQKKYQAQLDAWKAQQGQGNPYPVLQGMYDTGAFQGNPEMEKLVGFHLANPTAPESAKKIVDGLAASVAPTKTSLTLQQRKEDATAAQQFLAVVAPDLPDGVVKKRALAATGQQAIKMANRVIESTDFGKDQGHLDALYNYTQTPSFEAQPQTVKDKVISALAAKSPADASSVFSQVQPPASQNDAYAADANFITSTLGDPQLSKAVPESLRAYAAKAASTGGRPAQEAAKVLAESISGASTQDRQRLMASSQGQALLKANTADAITELNFADLDKFRGRSELFVPGGGYGSAVSDYWSKLSGGEPSQWTLDRKSLEQVSGRLNAAYAQSISGATIPVAEYERLMKNLGNLDSDSTTTFFAKSDYVRGAVARDRAYRQQLMDALLKGDMQAYMDVDAERTRDIGRTADVLEGVSGRRSGPSLSDASDDELARRAAGER